MSAEWVEVAIITRWPPLNPYMTIVVRRPIWMSSVLIPVVVVGSSFIDDEGGGVERLIYAAAPLTSSDEIHDDDKDDDAARIRSLDDGESESDDD